MINQCKVDLDLSLIRLNTEAPHDTESSRVSGEETLVSLKSDHQSGRRTRELRRDMRAI